MTQIQEVIEYYKTFKPLEVEAEGGNKAWDKKHFARFTRDAKHLLKELGTVDAAKEAIKWMSEQGYEWNLQTLALKKLAAYKIYLRGEIDKESDIGKFY